MLWFVIRLIFKTSSVTPDFFYVFNLILSFSTCSQSFNKICVWEVLGANVLKSVKMHTISSRPSKPELFKRWIQCYWINRLVQWTSVHKTNWAVHQIVIYPRDRRIPFKQPDNWKLPFSQPDIVVLCLICFPFLQSKNIFFYLLNSILSNSY